MAIVMWFGTERIRQDKPRTPGGIFEQAAVEKEYGIVPWEPDDVVVWILFGPICHYVVYHFGNQVGSHDDDLDHLRVFAGVLPLSLCRCMGGPLQPKNAHSPV